MPTDFTRALDLLSKTEDFIWLNEENLIGLEDKNNDGTADVYRNYFIAGHYRVIITNTPTGRLSFLMEICLLPSIWAGRKACAC
ncbi:MAG: hypothetical protein R3B93_05140 [Bacteroidia bacterium]